MEEFGFSFPNRRLVVIDEGGDTEEFTLESLGLDLDLRAKGNAANNDKLTFNNTGVALTVIGMTDQSKALALLATVWQSNFSAGVDSCTIHMGLSALDGNIDDIDDEDDTLRATCGVVGGSRQSVQRTNGLSNGEVMRVRGIVDIPSNANIDGLQITGGSAASPAINLISIPLGAWYAWDYYIRNITNTTIRLKALKGTDNTPDTIAGELFYLKNILVESIQGFHFGQNTQSNRPSYNDTRKSVDFDGVDNLLDDVNHTDIYTVSRRTDETGIFTLAFFDDEGSGNFCQILSMSDGTTNNQATMYIDTDNHLKMNFRRASVDDIIDFGEWTRGGFITGRVGTNVAGTAYYADEGGAVKTITGTNDGDWFASMTGMTVTKIGANGASTIFGAIGLRALDYKEDPTDILANVANIDATELYTE